MMNSIGTYQSEHLETLQAVRRKLSPFRTKIPIRIKEDLAGYNMFRQSVDLFLQDNFKETCQTLCFTNNKSACCSKEGIIAFFADMVINALNSTESQLDVLETALKSPNQGSKCIYLNPDGCMWQIRPLVCALFLCETAEKEVLTPNREIEKQWARFRQKQRQFRWPDKAVLFDALEKEFRRLEVDVSLMYFHNSPGLLNIKRKAGLE